MLLLGLCEEMGTVSGGDLWVMLVVECCEERPGSANFFYVSMVAGMWF